MQCKRFHHLCTANFFSNVALVSPKLLKEKSRHGILNFSHYDKFGIIDPLSTSATISSRLNGVIFDSLIQLDESFKIKPHVARSWERSKNGRTWTFHLHKGIRFHDGVELTSDDVVFTIEQLKKLPFGPNHFLIDTVEEVKAIDRYTLQIKLNKPIVSFLQVLSVGILPKHLMRERNPQKTSRHQHSIGTGPFILKSWSDEKIVLEANNNYFLGRPYLEKIQVLYYPSREAAWAKLMAGEVDYFVSLTPDNYQTLKQVPSLQLHSAPHPFYYSIAFNLQDEILTDRKVRQALNYAVDKKTILETVLTSQGQIASGTIFPNSWAYNPNVKPYPYAPKKTLSLLKEAGWEDHDGDYFLDKDGVQFEFTIKVNAGDDLKHKTLLLVQQNLFDIGIKMKIQVFQVENIDFLFKKQFQAHFPEIMARGDPDFSFKYWHSSEIEEGFNVSSYSNPVVDRLLEAGRQEFDSGKRKQIYFAYQKEIHRDPPMIFLFWTNTLAAVHHRFKGVKINSSYPFGTNIREWYVPKSLQK